MELEFHLQFLFLIVPINNLKGINIKRAIKNFTNKSPIASVTQDISCS